MYIKKINEKKENILKRNNIIIADFETIIINNKHYVYAIGWYHDYKYNEIIITDNIKENSNKIIIKFINKIIFKSIKYVYFHNLGAFDGVFILNAWNELIQKNIESTESINAIIRNNKILKITINKTIFIDSYNILPSSLNNLSIKFLNKKKYELNISKINIHNIKKNKTEISKYLKKDVFLLKNIIDIIRNKIYNEYNILIEKCITLSSLSFKIFRKKYMINENIYISNKKNIDKFLRKSYMGGIVNVFKPYGENLEYYDINSLYPYSMLKDMPIGEPKWYKKNQINNLSDINNIFGFIEVEITVPYAYIPILTHKNNQNILKLSYGKLKGVWFSEEIKLALKNGCIINKIINILEFKKENIFKNFVTDLYNKRINTKNDIEKYIYKIILNSLYGRFGMKKEIHKTFYIKKNDLELYEICFKHLNIIELKKNSNYILITIYFKDDMISLKTLDLLKISKEKKKSIKKIINTYESEINNMNIAVQISSAISSYSRIEMLKHIYEFQNNNIDIYYMDTDSIITNKKIHKKYTSKKEIGKFKLEYRIIKGWFISPKCYKIITNKNIKIIKFKGVPKDQIENFNDNWWNNRLIKNNLNENKFNYINPIKKNLKHMIIERIQKKYEYRNIFNKRIKIYKNNKWIDTKPDKN